MYQAAHNLISNLLYKRRRPPNHILSAQERTLTIALALTPARTQLKVAGFQEELPNLRGWGKEQKEAQIDQVSLSR